MKSFALAAIALLATTAMPVVAAPIVYTINGTFSGFTAGGAFSNVNATFTGTGDTSTATFGTLTPTFTSVALSTFTAFTLGDSTTYTITSPGTFGTYKAFDIVPGSTKTRLGFIFNGSGSNGIAIESDAFNGYSGLTSFATTAGDVYYQNATFNTDLGEINITGFTNGTFSAAVSAVPEPATWAIMLLGFGTIGFALRRAKVRTNVSFT
jgi:PEP-CTERM motif